MNFNFLRKKLLIMWQMFQFCILLDKICKFLSTKILKPQRLFRRLGVKLVFQTRIIFHKNKQVEILQTNKNKWLTFPECVAIQHCPTATISARYFPAPPFSNVSCFECKTWPPFGTGRQISPAPIYNRMHFIGMRKWAKIIVSLDLRRDETIKWKFTAS